MSDADMVLEKGLEPEEAAPQALGPAWKLPPY